MTVSTAGSVVLSPGLFDPTLSATRDLDTTSPEGLRIITVAGQHLSTNDLHAIYTFRYNQYRSRGWINTALADRLGLDAEPYLIPHAERDLHTLVIDSKTRKLHGYGTLAASRDPADVHLDNPDHQPFVVERDYNIRLADYLHTDTHVGEGKRLVRDHTMPRSAAGASIPWWVYLAWGRGCARFLHAHSHAAVVGDGKLDGAIHQLRLLGFTVKVLHETTPIPPADDDLFAPLWDQHERSYPFVLTDDAGTLTDTLDRLERVLRSGDPTQLRRKLSETPEGVE